jgi:hypothetical protein
VAAFFGGRRGALWAGLVSLTVYVYNTFTFNYIVIATGAWAQHPVEYLALNVASIPLALLFALVVRDVREAVGAGGQGTSFRHGHRRRRCRGASPVSMGANWREDDDGTRSPHTIGGTDPRPGTSTFHGHDRSCDVAPTSPKIR